MRAEIVVARCQRDGALVGLRCEERSGTWQVTWSFEIPDRNHEYHDGQGMARIGGPRIHSDYRHPGAAPVVTQSPFLDGERTVPNSCCSAYSACSS